MRTLSLSILYIGLASAAWSQTGSITAVLNNLGQPRMSPGDGVTVYGSFTPDRRPSFTVTIGGLQASLSSVVIDVKLNRAIEINLQVPTELSPGPASVIVTHVGDAPTAAFPVTVSQFDPVVPTDPFNAFLHMAGVAVTPSLPAAPGETITTFMNGLGATNPLIPTGMNAPNFTPTSSPVTVTVGGANAPVQFAGRYPINPPFTALNYQVSFNVPASASNGPNPVVVSIGGVDSNAQTLFVGTQALSSPPTVSKVVSGANFSTSTPITAGSFVSIFGTGFGSADNFSAFPSTQVNGISVLFNGRPAPIFALAASVGQINVLAPSEVPANGTVAVTVVNQNGPSKAVYVTMSAAGPAMFIVPDPSNASRRNIAALLANTAWYVMPVSEAQALGLTSCAGVDVAVHCGQPVKRGDFIQLYATGLGVATANADPNGAPLATGQVAPASGPVYFTLATPVVTVGGQAAKVVFSGLAPGFAGLYQVNVQIPQNISPGDSVPITIAIGGSAADSATVAVQ